MNTYPGSKSGSGSFQQIINEIPPINQFVTGFLGNCPLFRYFSQRIESKAFELADAVISNYDGSGAAGIIYHRSFFDEIPQLLASTPAGVSRFIYLDPPYPFFTRKSQKQLYAHELTDLEHETLLTAAAAMPGHVAISSYKNSMYDHFLKGWRIKQWNVTTRRGPATECLYMNYDHPRELFTYEFLGEDHLDRQRISRKIARWVNKLSQLPQLEQAAIIHALTRVPHR